MSRSSRYTQPGHAPRPRALLTGLVALIALAALLVGVPAALAAAAGWPLPTVMPTVDAVKTGLTSQLQWATVVKVFVCIAWLAWAQFVACVLVELGAQIRAGGFAIDAPRVPFAGANQAIARRLVSGVLALLLLVLPFAGTATAGDKAAPALTRARPAAAATATPAARPMSAAQPTRAMPAVADATGGPRVAAVRRSPGKVVLIDIVEKRDCLWDIAERHLPGDPAVRYKEIFELNKGRKQPDGSMLRNESLIQPGWQLILPADAVNVDRVLHVPPAPAATPATPPPESAPARPAAPAPAATPPVAPRPERIALPPAVAATAPGSLAATPAAPAASAYPPPPSATARPATSINADTDTQGERHEGNDPWKMLFAGGGALLAAGILTRLLNSRRRQFRNRRPGRTITPAPVDLAPAEQALLTYGTSGIADVKFLDHAMRSLSAALAADPDSRLPEIVAARMIEDQLDLRLGEPHPTAPPAPWAVDESGCWWSVCVSDPLPVDDETAAGYLAPYPTLVAVGYDQTGASWLLDLESVGALSLTGDDARCLDLGRFIAAELAVNAWAALSTVTMVGFGQELVALNPGRLRHTEDLATAAGLDLHAALEVSSDVEVNILADRMRGVIGDGWMPHVLLIAPHIARANTDSGELRELLDRLAAHRGRSTVAVVLAGAPATPAGPGSWDATISDDGILSVPALGIEVTAQQLPADRVEALGQLLAHAGQIEDAPIPAATGDKPYEQYTNVAGGLLPAVTLPRSEWPASAARADGDLYLDLDAAGADADVTSLLPLDDEEYIGVGVTSSDELQALAPRVDSAQRAAIIAADPTLDDDFADWVDQESTTPKLDVLGPLTLRARGTFPPRRVGYYTEVAVYLATCERGATAEQIAEAFGVTTGTIHSAINIVRAWLGRNPATGEEYLPDAMKSAEAKARGVGVYRIDGLAINGDLFKRLRARGEALGGSEGISYLVKALSLVTGRLFDQLRPGGYGWLARNPVNEHLTVAVVDVAHTVHLHHLHAGDLEGARHAAETAQLAAPDEEPPRLDLVAVMKAEGLHQAAERYLHDEVYNRSDDGDAPDDLPERTGDAVRRWSRAS